MPRAMVVKSVEEPPREIRGSVCPVSGDQVYRHHDVQQRLTGYQQRQSQHQQSQGKAVRTAGKISIPRKKIHR